MGNCCQYKKEKISSEEPSDDARLNMDFKIKEKESLNYKDNLVTEAKNNISSMPNEQRVITKESQNYSLFSFYKIDTPSIYNGYIRNNNMNGLNDLISESKSEDNNEFDVSLVSMEKNLFELINNLRANPKSFINKVEEYKNQLLKNDDFYYLMIEGNIFEFEKGAEHFDECIIFLKEQKTLKEFAPSPSMFESKKLIKDKNSSDLNFVLLYNLLDINSSQNDKIKRNCIFSEVYNKLNITISKEDFINDLYTFYFSFDE